MNPLRRLLWIPAAAAIALGWGCSSAPQSTTLTLPGGRYADAFDASRETLRDLRFDLERVDARFGVISTRPKPTDGIATPWDREQSSLSGEFEDLVHQQRRQIRIAFVPANYVHGPDVRTDGAPLQDAPAPRDLMDYSGDLVVQVRVLMSRAQRPGWRPSSNSVRGSTFTSDPVKEAAGLEPIYETPAGEDPELAAWIVERIRSRLSLSPADQPATLAPIQPPAETPASPQAPARP